MVKHAADEAAPLLTAEERVDARSDAGHGGQDASPRSSRRGSSASASTWSQNLSIDRDDFDDVPVFARSGGWARANKAFGGQLRADASSN